MSALPQPSFQSFSQTPFLGNGIVGFVFLPSRPAAFRRGAGKRGSRCLVCSDSGARLVLYRLREVDRWTDRRVGPVDDVLQCRRVKAGCLS